MSDSSCSPEWHNRFSEFMESVENGTLSHAEQLPLARVFTWEMVNEQELPEGVWLRHECGNRDCVNPEHAVLVPIGE